MSTGTEVTDCRLEDVVVTEAATLSLLWYLCVIIPHVIHKVFLIFPLKLQIPGCLIPAAACSPTSQPLRKESCILQKREYSKESLSHSLVLYLQQSHC